MADRRGTDRRKAADVVRNDRRVGARRTHIDRRDAIRTPLDLWMEEERGDELYFRRTGNVSEGGVFFEQTIPHNVGTKVKLRFALPGESHVIEANGEIVNTPADKDGLGMGLRFVDLSAADRERLRAYIARG